VKIRGFRVELGEIEAVLAAHPSVQECAVAAKVDDKSNRRLVAYVVMRSGHPWEVSSLRESLQRVLPDYMVPTAWVQLDRLPLSAHGKVDRRALPDPDLAAMRQDTHTVAPRNATERYLAEIWARILAWRRSVSRIFL